MELCQITPKVNALLQKENIQRNTLAKALGMPTSILNKMLNDNNAIWPWRTLSKVLWVLGYKVEGLRLSRREEIKQ